MAPATDVAVRVALEVVEDAMIDGLTLFVIGIGVGAVIMRLLYGHRPGGDS